MSIFFPSRLYLMVLQEILNKLQRLTSHSNVAVRFNSRQILYTVGVMPHEPAGGGYRILSIDGGGTRGIIAIR